MFLHAHSQNMHVTSRYFTLTLVLLCALHTMLTLIIRWREPIHLSNGTVLVLN